MFDLYTEALQKLVSPKEARRLREEYSWAISRLVVQGLTSEEIAQKIIEMSNKKS